MTGAPVRWALALVGSLLAHAALIAGLLVALRPDPVPDQPTPETRLDIAAYTLERSEARAAIPDAPAAAEDTAAGTSLASGAIPQSRASAAEPPSTRAPATTPRAQRLTPDSAPAPTLATMRPDTAALSPAQAPQARLATAAPTGAKVPATAPANAARLSATPDPAGPKIAAAAPEPRAGAVTTPLPSTAKSLPPPADRLASRADTSVPVAALTLPAAALAPVRKSATPLRADGPAPQPLAPAKVVLAALTRTDAPTIAAAAMTPKAAPVAAVRVVPVSLPQRDAPLPSATPVAPSTPALQAIAPDTTAAPTATPDTTAAPAATPDTTTAPAAKPDTTATPAAAPDTTTAPAAAPDTTATPAAAPDTTAAPAATPDTTATPAAAPDTTAAPAAKPDTTAAPAAAPDTTAAPAATPDTTAAPAATPDTTATPEVRPEAERMVAALAFSGEGAGNADPLSLAAFQSFMRPGDPTANGDALRDGVAGLLAQVPCSRLQVAFDPETATLSVNGHIPEGDLRAPVLAALQEQMGTDITVSDNMLILPRPQCGALSGIASVGLAQSTDQITNPLLIGENTQARVLDFVKNDRLHFDLVAPDYDAYIYVDYFDAGGNVLHLIPNDSVPITLSPAAGTLRVGTQSDADTGLRIFIGPPYGQEISVAFAASAPLYDGTRPLIEPAAPYLDWLKARVAQARANDPGFKGEWVYFFVTTAEK